MRWRWGLVLLLPLLMGGGYLLNDIQPNSITVTQLTAQVIAAGNIIASNQCGGLKLVSAAGAVNTDATNAFTASTTAGCTMFVCNVSSGANTITIKHSTVILTFGGTDVSLVQKACVTFGTDGTLWYQLSAVGTNS